jgi:hypothetical protein
MMHFQHYAGIGSRKTPQDCLTQMTLIARHMTDRLILRSGGALGADTAFANGTANREIHVPWSGYNGLFVSPPSVIVPDHHPEAYRIAAAHHPKWKFLTDGVKRLMCRNVTIILGRNLDEHAKLVIAWTPDGLAGGGTGHGIRVAKTFGIPVFDLARESDQQDLVTFVKERWP